jgi:hypothetical protein
MEISWYQMVRMNDNYLGSEIEVHLFNHSTNTISATDGELSTVRENKGAIAEWGSISWSSIPFRVS